MPQPTQGSVLVAGPLQNVSVAFRPEGYIGDQVFPIIDRVDPKAKIGVYSKGAWFRDEAGIRAPGSRAPRGGYPTSFIDISTKEYAFAREVTDEDRRLAQSQNAMPLKPDQDAIEFATGKIDLKKERRIRDLIVATTWADGNAGGGEDAAGLWAPSDNTNTFIADCSKAKAAIYAKTGLEANALVVDFGTYLKLCDVAEVLDRIKHVQRAVLTADLIAGIIGVKHLLLGRGIYSTGKEKKDGTDFTASSIWEVNAGKGMAFMYYRPDSPGLKIPSAGYQARTQYDDGSVRRVEMWREAAEHQDVYEVAEQTDIVAVSADLGYLFKDTLLT